MRNGELLKRAESQFDFLITMDTGMTQQQNIRNYDISIIILHARSNRLADTRPLMPKVIALLETVAHGAVVTIGNQ